MKAEQKRRSTPTSQQIVFLGRVTLAAPGANAGQEAASEGDQVLAISGDYAQPVTVNGFACKNCTDVDYAKKHIDPAHPKDGPYGVNAKDGAGKAERGEALRFGGALAGLDPGVARPTDPATGAKLDVYA